MIIGRLIERIVLSEKKKKDKKLNSQFDLQRILGPGAESPEGRNIIRSW